jgi:hypothetical protein
MQIELSPSQIHVFQLREIPLNFKLNFFPLKVFLSPPLLRTFCDVASNFSMKYL